jgi:prepilin peptidase CpaA
VHGVGADLVFGALLVVVCVADLRTRRIPNAVVACVCVCGVVYSLTTGPWLVAAERAFGGLAVGLILWLPFYLLRLIGAGDVKFFAAGATWLGIMPAMQAAVLSALVGAALAVIWIGVTAGWRSALTRILLSARRPLQPPPAGAEQGAIRLPYGVAMAAGLAIAGWLPRLTAG